MSLVVALLSRAAGPVEKLALQRDLSTVALQNVPSPSRRIHDRYHVVVGTHVHLTIETESNPIAAHHTLRRCRGFRKSRLSNSHCDAHHDEQIDATRLTIP